MSKKDNDRGQNIPPSNNKSPEQAPEAIPRRRRGPRTSCHIRLTAQAAKLSRFPTNLKTIGDHILKRRLDLRKDQRGGSHAIGVTEDTISSWERCAHEPALEYMPKVIEFPGYVPFETCKTLGERIRFYRMSLGLSQVDFARRLGVTHSTVRAWEKDRVKNVEKKIRPFLEGLVEFDKHT